MTDHLASLLHAMPVADLPPLNRRHHQRLREIYRSSGWPCHDVLEVELLAHGVLERQFDDLGREQLRVTDAGIQLLARAFASNRAARSAHEDLVEQVAHAQLANARLAWRGLMLRVPLSAGLFEQGENAPDDEAAGGVAEVPRSGLGASSTLHLAMAPSEAQSEAEAQAEAAMLTPGQIWAMACPDVFSVRRTTVEAYLEPVVHEIKVSRADLLGDLRNPAKRAAYLAMASACWYVIGCNAKGKPIAEPDEIPEECGVMLFAGGQLSVLREAPRRGIERLPFSTWMALAKATPVAPPEAGQMTF